MTTRTRAKASNALDALDRARVELEQFFLDDPNKFGLRTKGDELLAWQCANSIFGSVAMLVTRLPRKHDGPDSISFGGIARRLQALEDTAKTGGKTWQNAWNALPPAAYYELCAAYQRANNSMPMPRFAGVPPAATLRSALPLALKAARDHGKEMPFRDNAVVAIFQAYWFATGEDPTPKRTKLFLNKIEDIFVRHRVLPAVGLGVTKSAATLHRLIEQATKAA
jgi:hypothetical protein